MAFLGSLLGAAAGPVLSSLFGSPTSQATSAEQAQAALSQQQIAQEEQYVNQQQTNLQNAIKGLGPNPYFAAAQANNPNAFAVNPTNTTNFSTNGTTGQTSVTPGTAQPYTPAAPNLPANAFGGSAFSQPGAGATTSSNAPAPVTPGTGPISLQPIPGTTNGFGYGITGATTPLGSPTNAFQLSPTVPYPGSQAAGSGGP